MILPRTTNKLIFWMDPSEKHVSLTSNNRVTSIIEKVSGRAISPEGPSFQPVWTDNSLNGRPTIRFNGGQNLRFNLDIRASTGKGVPIVMYAVARTLLFNDFNNPPFGETIAALGGQFNGNNGMLIQTGINAGNRVLLARYDNNDNFDAPNATLIDNGYHIFTAIYDLANVKLRVDGNYVSSVSAVIGTGSFDGTQVGIGDYTSAVVPIFGHNHLTGNVGSVLVYAGMSGNIDLGPEDYLRQYYGI